MPTSAAKSPAGRLLRRQVSSKSRRFSGVRGEAGASFLRSRRPRRPRPPREGKRVNKASSGSSGTSGGGSPADESAGDGGLNGGRLASARAVGGAGPRPQ